MSTPSSIVDYLRKTIEMGGSDLHLAVGSPPAIRVRGAIVAVSDEPLSAEQVKDLVRATMSETQRARLEEDWELDYAIEVRDLGRFRGNVFYSKRQMEAVYRHVPSDVPELSSLGHYQVVEDLCSLQRGLVLVTGVTGSGKSTTLASMVRRISEQRAGVIVTIEDPIEFNFQHALSLIRQREIGRDTRNFASALRQALRQDPDVIVVSEMRDPETIQTALTAAETGHLVLSTLHTGDAPQSIDRIIDVFPAEKQQQIASQLGNVLEGIVCQRLLPGTDPAQRVLATEVLRMNHAVRNCVRDRKNEQIVGLMEIGARDGMHTIDECLKDLVQRERIDRNTASAHCRDKHLFPAEETPAPERKKRSIW